MFAVPFSYRYLTEYRMHRSIHYKTHWVIPFWLCDAFGLSWQCFCLFQSFYELVFFTWHFETRSRKSVPKNAKDVCFHWLFTSAIGNQHRWLQQSFTSQLKCISFKLHFWQMHNWARFALIWDWTLTAVVGEKKSYLCIIHPTSWLHLVTS